jgi:outer membrane translocation and assembly module TamA
MPETQLGYGALGGVHFRVEPGLQTSDVQLIVSGTTRQQAFLRLNSLVFPTERLAFGGTLRLFDYPDFFWGVGGDAPSSAKESFTSRYVEAQLTAEWYVVPRRLRTGPRVWFRQEALRDLQPGGQLAAGTLPGSEGWAAPGFGWGAVWDSRDSRFFPRSGSSVEAWYLYAPRVDRGAEPFGRASLDASRFDLLGRGIVLGLQAHLELSHGEVPVTILPRLGGDQNLRGYYYGRWRDDVMYSGQAELRVPIVWRVLGAVFAGVSEVASSLGALGAGTVRPAAGAGARVRLTDDGLDVRLDVGVGAEGANAYFGLGEAF